MKVGGRQCEIRKGAGPRRWGFGVIDTAGNGQLPGWLGGRGFLPRLGFGCSGRSSRELVVSWDV